MRRVDDPLLTSAGTWPTVPLPRRGLCRWLGMCNRAASFLVCFDATGQYCGPFVEILVVGDMEVGLAKHAGLLTSLRVLVGRQDAPSQVDGERPSA